MFKTTCHQSYLKRNYCVNKQYWSSIYIKKDKEHVWQALKWFQLQPAKNISCTNSFWKNCKLRQIVKCELCDIPNKDIRNFRKLESCFQYSAAIVKVDKAILS